MVQGRCESLAAMREWLSSVGSPKSRIDGCEFDNERELEDGEALEFGEFAIRR